jgi:hypothetical protein
MISLIVCSRNPHLFDSLVANVQRTIGTTHELIRVDNAANHLSISAAYNQGASQARYPYLCFVHEDVLFETPDWGVLALGHFAAVPGLEAIGVAGSTVKTRAVSTWWQPALGPVEPKRLNLIQHYKFTATPAAHLRTQPEAAPRSRVVCLDGVFLFVTRAAWLATPFDADLLTGFHAYDLDFTLRLKQVYVVYDILLAHYSEGRLDIDWLLASERVHYKHRHRLPISLEPALAARNLAPAEQEWRQYARVIVARHLPRLRLAQWYALARANPRLILNRVVGRRLLRLLAEGAGRRLGRGRRPAGG